MLVGDRTYFIKANVETKQFTQKRYFDNKKGAKESLIAEGDWVVIKLPTFVKKGNAKFSELVRVELVLGNAVRVQGNKWWNKSKEVKLKGKWDPQVVSSVAASRLRFEWLLGGGQGVIGNERGRLRVGSSHAL
ncbi:hypothetical protein NDU88_005495 [Pleurodeles waltl]|uniref:Uncharacterized protein n=1 Tax=Pleurodeles waltl TaxID=8319 RepID=A0AAV7WUV5_PLEWA|nr:hypothetical protein NDU88_005495 [Pleurodeles waltl]